MDRGLEIVSAAGRRVLDSEGKTAVEAEVELENGARGKALIAASEEEGLELWFEVFCEGVLFEDASDQRYVDGLLMELVRSCGGFGRGIAAALSMAVSRAAAAGLKLPLYRYLGGSAPGKLPVPMMTMINGGSLGCGNSLDMEAFMVVPVGAPSFDEGVRWCSEVYHTLKRLLANDGFQTGVGEDGGFVPDLRNAEEALGYLTDAMTLCGFQAGEDMMLAVSVGADRLFDEGTGFYQFKGESRKSGVLVERDRNDMIGLYVRLLDGFPICAVFDCLAEADPEGRRMMTKMLGNRAVFVGEHPGKWKAAVERRRVRAGEEGETEEPGEENAVGISMCAAGSVTAAMEMAEEAKRGGLRIAVAGSCGETEDAFAADFAAAVSADWIKAGAPCRAERTSKYNELLRIEEWMRGYAV